VTDNHIIKTSDRKVKEDKIVVVYLWDCLGINIETKSFRTIDEVIYFFRDENKDSLLNSSEDSFMIQDETILIQN